MADKNALERIFASSPSLGSGLAGKAQNELADRGYKLHVEEAKATGETPLTYEEWKKQQNG
jgi:hypothetical protein